MASPIFQEPRRPYLSSTVPHLSSVDVPTFKGIFALGLQTILSRAEVRCRVLTPRPRAIPQGNRLADYASNEATSMYPTSCVVWQKGCEVGPWLLFDRDVG